MAIVSYVFTVQVDDSDGIPPSSMAELIEMAINSLDNAHCLNWQEV